MTKGVTANGPRLFAVLLSYEHRLNDLAAMFFEKV
jgi:hypothetical protein